MVIAVGGVISSSVTGKELRSLYCAVESPRSTSFHTIADTLLMVLRRLNLNTLVMCLRGLPSRCRDEGVEHKEGRRVGSAC